ncbi:MAG: hypothetical protein ING72_11595 [Methylobacterium sp.]|jgi:hypothetical protein|nr:hypothetical protein [Methylobacterium sp.]MCA3596924.1 hypothetical protein [Methylobacterium sp.]MCA3602056.1 hypothetical protein [Methylobacterium sp.]MCA3607645.1 hypothetical protein [Methylobacterium sp.]MCA3610679.1 hypothetical protein [Methylobacterium sp.]
MRRASLIAASLFAIALSVPAQAREEIPAESRFAPFSGVVDTCESSSVLASIQSRFASTERRFWNSNAEIIGFERIQQTGLRQHGIDLIPRRTCEAVAVMGDRKRLKLHYAIIEAYGFAGYGNQVTFCLAGYDRNLTNGGDCSRLPGR